MADDNEPLDAAGWAMAIMTAIDYKHGLKAEALEELKEAFKDPNFKRELRSILTRKGYKKWMLPPADESKRRS